MSDPGSTGITALKAHWSLLKYIISGFLPFVVVENFWFKKFCYELNKNYVLPSRKYLSGSLLDKYYNETMCSIKTGTEIYLVIYIKIMIIKLD